MYTKSLRTYNSVDHLPEEVPTGRLEEFKIQVGRGAEVTVSDEADYELQSSADGEEIMREINTEKFTVQFVAKTCSYLELNWLYTEAHFNGDLLIIDSSARYSQSDVEEYGTEKVARWINEDRRELAKIMEAYCSYRSDTEIFDAEVRVIRDKLGVVGRDTIGGCIYDSHEDFLYNGGYADDLLSIAIQEARDTIHDIQKDLC